MFRMVNGIIAKSYYIYMSLSIITQLHTNDKNYIQQHKNSLTHTNKTINELLYEQWIEWKQNNKKMDQ